MNCKDCVHCEICREDKMLTAFDENQEALCKAFKPKSRFVELPCDDEVIIYVKGNWLMLNMESKDLGRAIKATVDYSTKNALQEGAKE